MDINKVSFFTVAASFFLMCCASAQLNNQGGRSEQTLKKETGFCEDFDNNFDWNRSLSQAYALIKSYAHSFIGACLGVAAGNLLGPHIMPYIGPYLEYMPLGIFDVVRFALFTFMNDNYLKRLMVTLLSTFILTHVPKLLIALVDHNKEYCTEKTMPSGQKQDFIIGSSYAISVLGFSSILVWTFLRMLHSPFFMQPMPEAHIAPLPRIDYSRAAAAAA